MMMVVVTGDDASGTDGSVDDDPPPADDVDDDYAGCHDHQLVIATLPACLGWCHPWSGDWWQKSAIEQKCMEIFIAFF